MIWTCLLPALVVLPGQAQAVRELSSWARGMVRPAEPVTQGLMNRPEEEPSQWSDAKPRQCVATQMGNPCPQGGVATLGAARPGPDFGMGNPVDRRSGNKYQRDTDLPALWAAPGLELVRHYNAMDPRRGALGRGWSWSYDTRLFQVFGAIQIVQADGSRLDFTCDAGTDSSLGCRGPDPMHGRIRRIADGWRWTWPLDTTVVFDRDGQLVRVDQRGGRARIEVRRHHGASKMEGALDEITAYPSGARLRFRYDVSGDHAILARVETPAGEFRYDFESTQGGPPQLAMVTRPDGMQRRYHHEPEFQSGHADALTGISIAAGAGGKAHTRALRTHTWHYDPTGRASLFIPGESQGDGVRLPIAFDDRALGLDARRDTTGRLRALRLPVRGWPGLRLDFDADGVITAWSARGVGAERRTTGIDRRLREREFSATARWQWRTDWHGRVSSMRAVAESVSVDTQIDWRGLRPVVVQHPLETQTLRYDRSGNLRARVISRPAVGAEPELRLIERYAYDARGDRTVHALAEGGRLLFAWTPGGRLISVAWEDAAGVRFPVLDGTAAGLRHGNGLLTAGVMSASGLTTLMVYQPATGTAPFLQTRSYDAYGRVARELEVTAGARQTTVYGRDPDGRLTRFRSWGAAPGSFRPLRATTRLLAWNDSGAARAAHDGVDERTPEIVRDATGLPVRVGRFVTQYGPQRRLVRATRIDQPGLRAEYGHNGFGERIWRDDGTGRTHYLHDDARLAAEARAGRSGVRITRRYIYARQVPVAMIDYAPSGAQLYMIHTDAVGLPRLVTDMQQRIRWQGRFSPLGRLLEEHGDLHMPLRLPGQIADPLTGWHENYQRTYDPEWGHYLEPDPLGPVPGNSLFGYADQQPRRHVDPLGLMLFAFDGTGNRPESLTNVWLMAQAYRDGAVHYVPGPGTARSVSQAANVSDTALAWSGATRVDSHWERLLNALALHRQNGSARPGATPAALPLDIVGFSRGAALGRDFGNRVARHVRDGRFWARHPLHGIVSQCVDLRFMGLFDTVAQFNVLGAGNAAYDLTIAPAWKWVAHAVALHERRWLFPLTSAQGTSNVVERPFVGAHADIGGGYLTPRASPGSTPGDLSSVALAWMRWQAHAAGVAIDDTGGVSSVRSPVVHDERAVFTRRMQDSDRSVRRADGSVWANYQDELPLMGRPLRREVENFIARRPHPLLQGADAVGRVDMAAYAQWLERTTGLR